MKLLKALSYGCILGCCITLLQFLIWFAQGHCVSEPRVITITVEIILASCGVVSAGILLWGYLREEIKR